jgi:hypothetical protein
MSLSVDDLAWIQEAQSDRVKYVAHAYPEPIVHYQDDEWGVEREWPSLVWYNEKSRKMPKNWEVL